VQSGIRLPPGINIRPGSDGPGISLGSGIVYGQEENGPSAISTGWYETMTRTTVDVINDLDSAVPDRDAVYTMAQTALVVGFEQECRMLFHDDPDRLKKLNSMVQNGGTPLGLIKATKIGNNVNFLSRPLIEFKDDPATARLLTELCKRLGTGVAHRQNGISARFSFQIPGKTEGLISQLGRQHRLPG
jgi:hypothetical protein